MNQADLPHAACARYGLLGLPLAFVALPLYVVLPAHYGQTLGVPLGLLGAVLLGARLADALVDPLIGRWVDRLLNQPARAARAMWVMAAVLSLGFAALFFPLIRGEAALLWWCAATMMWTFLAYSLGSVLYLAWGSRLGGNVAQRARIVAWREGFGLLGVVLANLLAVQAGLGWTALALFLSLLLGVGGLVKGPRPSAQSQAGGSQLSGQDLRLPWQGAAFRRLLGLFLLNGVASAIPATLVLFFIQDRLQAQAWTAACLGVYFLMAAVSMPWWAKAVARLGPMRAWSLGMALSVLSFAGVLGLGAGDVMAYLLICACSGWALGADLTAPGTLLTGVVQQAGHAEQAEGVYAGWWQWATKLNLALAAGLALPALQYLGYVPGARDAQALLSLTLVYGALPCLFKLLSLAWCWRWRNQLVFA
ncbi:MFS transporter [Aquabacterium sp. NJ1]|uniref:MFS transporter n=1 Tax=Aquabacterium sp. NJ1 TaxID=1538295 RepID=UPI00068ED6D6|nr:MFS transporter [Aquabacterium sp. NJ1]